jgi:two-component system cell cycle sensor histidine kinase/response regulator CckA
LCGSDHEGRTFDFTQIFLAERMASELRVKTARKRHGMRKARATGPTVLMVDDEEVDRTAISRILRSQNYTVLEAETYSDAMAVFDLNRHAVKLVVADVCLPDGNGCALAIAMRKQKPDLRVLFVSFHVGAEVCESYGLDLAGLHFLRKPFVETELAARVEEVLKSATPFPRLYAPKTLTSSVDRA